MFTLMLLLHYIYLQDTVFKCTRKFVFISGMMRVTDQEMTAIEKVIFHLQFLRRRSHPTNARPHGVAPGLVRKQKE